MFKKPEIVEIAAAGLGFLFLLWSVALLYQSRVIELVPFYDIAYLAFIAIALCTAGELFLASSAIRYITLILHLLAFLLLTATLGGRFLLSGSSEHVTLTVRFGVEPHRADS